MSKLNGLSRLIIAGVAGLLTVGAAGCTGAGQPAQEEPAVDLAAEEAAVREINATWLELYRARDAEGIAALFMEDAWTLGDDGVIEGRAAILADMVADFEESPDATSDWGAKQVWVAASGDLAVERGWWTTDEDGPGEGEAQEGEYITILAKVGDRWMIVADAAVPLTGDEEEGEAE